MVIIGIPHSERLQFDGYGHRSELIVCIRLYRIVPRPRKKTTSMDVLVLVQRAEWNSRLKWSVMPVYEEEKICLFAADNEEEKRRLCPILFSSAAVSFFLFKMEWHIQLIKKYIEDINSQQAD